MKKTLKRLITSLFIALTVAPPQAIHGTEEMDKEKIKNQSHIVPGEITHDILIKASYARILELGSAVSFKSVYVGWQLVCKDWHRIIEKEKNKDGFFTNSIISAYGLLGYGEICKRFLKGVLIYRPQKGSDAGRINLRISDLANPLEGTFDLSQCGDTGQHLSISTGYRKGRREENTNKVEIWFAPRFLIEKELTTTAGHFQEIYGKWWRGNVPVGIFWTQGAWDNLTDMDYLTIQNMDNISNNNLYEKWLACMPYVGKFDAVSWGRVDVQKDFMFIL